MIYCYLNLNGTAMVVVSADHQSIADYAAGPYFSMMGQGYTVEEFESFEHAALTLEEISAFEMFTYIDMRVNSSSGADSFGDAEYEDRLDEMEDHLLRKEIDDAILDELNAESVLEDFKFMFGMY